MREENFPPKDVSKKVTKCTVVHLPLDLLEQLDKYKKKNGKSKNATIVECIRRGLSPVEEEQKLLFFVKVRIDMNKLTELRQKLNSGDLDTGAIRNTYCNADDPSVGMSIWEAGTKEEFEERFAPHKTFYAEIMEITEVTTPQEALERLTAGT